MNETSADRAQRILGRILTLIGIVLLLFVGAVWLRLFALERDARPVHGRGAHAFARSRKLREDLSSTDGAGPIGHLEIPRLGIKAPLLEGIDDGSLLMGVGHVPNTAFPGEPDNAALAGHRDTHFAKLRGIREGDRIRVDTPDGVFTYEVDSSFVVTPDRGDLLKPTGRPMLTLVTCYPFHWIGAAPKRFIVRAHGVPEKTASL